MKPNSGLDDLVDVKRRGNSALARGALRELCGTVRVMTVGCPFQKVVGRDELAFRALIRDVAG
jgi:hypothetical protein